MLPYPDSGTNAVGAGLASGGTAEHEAEERALAPATIEAVHELVQVALQVLPAHAVERAPEPGLEIPEDRMRPRQDLRRTSAVAALNAPVVANTGCFQASTASRTRPAE